MTVLDWSETALSSSKSLEAGLSASRCAELEMGRVRRDRQVTAGPFRRAKSPFIGRAAPAPSHVPRST